MNKDVEFSYACYGLSFYSILVTTDKTYEELSRSERVKMYIFPTQKLFFFFIEGEAFGMVAKYAKLDTDIISWTIKMYMYVQS